MNPMRINRRLQPIEHTKHKRQQFPYWGNPALRTARDDYSIDESFASARLDLMLVSRIKSKRSRANRSAEIRESLSPNWDAEYSACAARRPSANALPRVREK